jgi:RHS repeat-associated protein
MSEFRTSTLLSSATAAASSDRIQYRVGEQTGIAVMLMAADGTPRENNRVFSFGEPWNSNSGSDNNHKFTSYQRDGETDIDYAMARYYSSRSGRFLSSDSSSPTTSVPSNGDANCVAPDRSRIKPVYETSSTPSLPRPSLRFLCFRRRIVMGRASKKRRTAPVLVELQFVPKS